MMIEGSSQMTASSLIYEGGYSAPHTIPRWQGALFITAIVASLIRIRDLAHLVSKEDFKIKVGKK